MIPSLVSFIPPFLIGTLLVSLVFQESMFIRLPLKLSLGFGAGMGITSCLYFFWSLSSNPGDPEYFLVEGALLFALVITGVKNRIFTGIRLNFKDNWSKLSRINRIVIFISTLLLLGFVISTILDLYVITSLNPHGRYDTYNIWDYRARMIYRGGIYWLESFSPKVWHSDYPLLVPLGTARGWLMAGREFQQVPSLQGIIFVFALVAILFSALLQLKDYSQAIFSAFILLGTKLIITHSAYQLADTPMAYYILAFVVCAVLYTRISDKRPGLVFLAGLFAGFAAWTKNEGTLVLIFSFLWIAAVKIKTPFKEYSRILFLFMAGLALPLTAYLYFKLRFAPPPSDYADLNNLHLVYRRALDINRYRVVLSRYISGFWNISLWKAPVILLLTIYAIFSKIDFNRQKLNGFLAPILLPLFLLPIYLVNYVTSPLDLAWYLSTSLERIIWQIFPALLLAFLLVTRSPSQVFFKDGYNLTK